MECVSMCYCRGLWVGVPRARRRRSIGCPPPRKSNYMAMASSSSNSHSGDHPKLDYWDQRELKFGRLVGDDPQLTLAKIMGKKSNPDVSYLDIEKSFNKNKGRLYDDIVEVRPNDDEAVDPYNSHLIDEIKITGKSLNLARPIRKEETKSGLPYGELALTTETKSSQSPQNIAKEQSISNVTLRKPSIRRSDDIEIRESSKLEIKPNLFLKMRKGLKENAHDKLAKKDNISNVPLLNKPNMVQPVFNSNQDMQPVLNSNQDNVLSGDIVGFNSGTMSSVSSELSDEEKVSDIFQQNSSHISLEEGVEGPSKNGNTSFSRLSKRGNELKTGLQQIEQNHVISSSRQMGLTQPLGENLDHSSSSVSILASLQGKPERSSLPRKMKVHLDRLSTDLNSESHRDSAELKQFKSTILEDHVNDDWMRVEELLHSAERGVVELISSSNRGFVVSFGSLVGFLPYRNLGAKWKFLAFESWLRKKGLDPSLSRQNLSTLDRYDVQNNSPLPDSSSSHQNNRKIEENPSPDTKLEALLQAYDQEKMHFLSSFVGQRITVSVVSADRMSRRLIFSQRSKEKEELVDKKRSVMARLGIGDVVKCTIKKITYFGIFVELEGVPALIHQSEVSWDATLDPSSYFKIGQIVEAKVQRLDFGLLRITLSLKQLVPDPLVEALESLRSGTGHCNSSNGRMEIPRADIEWADVESLIRELQMIEGVDCVLKGRFSLSPGLAPTFQVYMASVFQNQYKLLARSGNKVQEVIVQSSLDKEQMKAAIQTCTSRVE